MRASLTRRADQDDSCECQDANERITRKMTNKGYLGERKQMWRHFNRKWRKQRLIWLRRVQTLTAPATFMKINSDQAKAEKAKTIWEMLIPHWRICSQYTHHTLAKADDGRWWLQVWQSRARVFKLKTNVALLPPSILASSEMNQILLMKIWIYLPL